MANIRKKRFRKISTIQQSTEVEQNTMISDVVPDQNLTVRELFTRHVNGTLNDIGHQLFYSEDMPDLRGLDFAELDEMKRTGAINIHQLKDAVQEKLEQERIDRAIAKNEAEKLALENKDPK